MAFVIRAYPRSGTHMLRTALDQHPEITCHSEIFNPDVTSIDVLKNSTAEEIYNAHTQGRCEGFVVHGYTDLESFAQIERHNELWELLKDRQHELIIVERRDQLRRVFSLNTARHTQRWHIWRSDCGDHVLPASAMKPSAVAWQIKCATRSYAANRKLFPNANFFYYEDIVDNWVENISRMQKIIGVKNVLPMKPKTVKQDQRPIQEMVSNYQEIKKYFKGCDFEYLFDYAENNNERRAV